MLSSTDCRRCASAALSVALDIDEPAANYDAAPRALRARVDRLDLAVRREHQAERLRAIERERHAAVRVGRHIAWNGRGCGLARGRMNCLRPLVIDDQKLNPGDAGGVGTLRLVERHLIGSMV